MLNYYVYYRVAAGQEAQARERVQSLLRDLAEATGVHGRLLVKRGESALWMEVYEQVADAMAFESALTAAVDKGRLEGVLEPGARRHLECFED